MITMTEFIEKVNAIMGQENMDDKKANQLCHLYADIYHEGHNRAVEETREWLKAHINDYLTHGRDIDCMFDDLKHAVSKNNI